MKWLGRKSIPICLFASQGLNHGQSQAGFKLGARNSIQASQELEASPTPGPALARKEDQDPNQASVLPN